MRKLISLCALFLSCIMLASCSVPAGGIPSVDEPLDATITPSLTPAPAPSPAEVLRELRTAQGADQMTLHTALSGVFQYFFPNIPPAIVFYHENTWVNIGFSSGTMDTMQADAAALARCFAEACFTLAEQIDRISIDFYYDDESYGGALESTSFYRDDMEDSAKAQLFALSENAAYFEALMKGWDEALAGARHPVPAEVAAEPFLPATPLSARWGETRGLDLDGDGLEDRIFRKEMTPYWHNSLRISFGDGRVWELSDEWPWFEAIAAADLDRDGEREIVMIYDTGGVGGAGQHSMRALRRGTDGGYEDMPLPSLDSGWSMYVDAEAKRRDGYLLEVTQSGLTDGAGLALGGGTRQTVAIPREGNEPFYDEKGRYTHGGWPGNADAAYGFRIIPVLEGCALECRQYVSGGDGGHVDGVGAAVTQLIWEDGTCRVIGQWFEPWAYEEHHPQSQPKFFVQDEVREGEHSVGGVWAEALLVAPGPEMEGSSDIDVHVLGTDHEVLYTIDGHNKYRALERAALADLDRDGTEEMVLMFATHGTGGKGTHGMVVLRLEGDEVVSIPIPGGDEYSHMGKVTLTPLPGYLARIENQRTGFRSEFYLPRVRDEDGPAPRYGLYEEGGVLREPVYTEQADCVYDFEFTQYGDHWALTTRQYVWAGTHVNGFGDWVSSSILRNGEWVSIGEHLEWYP